MIPSKGTYINQFNKLILLLKYRYAALVLVVRFLMNHLPYYSMRQPGRPSHVSCQLTVERIELGSQRRSVGAQAHCELSARSHA